MPKITYNMLLGDRIFIALLVLTSTVLAFPITCLRGEWRFDIIWSLHQLDFAFYDRLPYVQLPKAGKPSVAPHGALPAALMYSLSNDWGTDEAPVLSLGRGARQSPNLQKDV